MLIKIAMFCHFEFKIVELNMFVKVDKHNQTTVRKTSLQRTIIGNLNLLYNFGIITFEREDF